MNEARKAKRIQELENLAGKIRELKRRVRPRRPIVIEFAGSPKAGKSSCISSLDIFLRRNGFNTRVLTERASVCPMPNKFDPAFNLWTGCAALSQLMDTLANAPRSLDVIVMDRGFFDALCWFRWQRKEGFLREDDYERFIAFFTAPRFRMTIDLVLSFEASPATSAEREYRNLLTSKEGSIMRDSVLAGYLDAIKETRSENGKRFRKILEYRTDDKDQNEVSYEVTKLTLDSLKSIADERIAHVSREMLPDVSGEFNYSEIVPALENNIQFEERDDVEENSELVQFIPAVVLIDRDRQRFLVGKKAQRAVSDNSPEKGRILLYFGGHVREEDSNMFDEPDFLAVLKQCAYREVREELGIDVDPSADDPTCVWVKDGTKSEKHILVIFPIEHSLDHLKIRIDQEEFVKYERKAEIGTGQILTTEELKKLKLDTWSESILRLYGSESDNNREVQLDLIK